MSIMPSSSYDTAMATARYGKTPEAEVKIPKDMDKIREAAIEFEAMFIGEMLNHMFAGIDTDPMFGGGSGEKMWQGMMIQEYGKIMARGTNNIGLADHIQKAMIELQQHMQEGDA
jgi:flagellar protein FlgJ